MNKKLISILIVLFATWHPATACDECGKPIVKDVVAAKAKYFSIADVRLLDSPFKHAMELNAQWMNELDMDRLLSNFRTNAQLKPKGEPYGSWESMGIAGHTLGHYLTAVSQHYAATGDETFKAKADYIVNELDSCQTNFVNGFIGGMPGGDKVFKEVKKGIIRSMGFDLNGIWVPWYNVHKTMMGLSDAYLLAGNEKALKLLINLSDYLADVIVNLTEEQMQIMLNCEYGGMNEAFAQVYALTGDKKYLNASYAFYHKKLQDKLAEGVDALQGLHSNTQIPKMIGSARQYELTGNPRDEKIARFSWETIVHHHSYANGGNSMGEYLSVPDKLNDRLGSNTCETCNTYNMLKLTQHLYEWTNDPQYLDYYERALYNHILASQHPFEGNVCYFLSLGMGTKKGFGSRENNFSCCMGSGFENHSKYGGAIYSYLPGQDALNINLYIPSVLTWNEKNLKLKMTTAYPEQGKVVIRLEESPKQSLDINLRYPGWATSEVTVKVNGSKQKVTTTPGSFITLHRTWKKGDMIELNLPMQLYTVSMPDNADRRAVFYGPSLLAGVFGTQERKMGDIPVFVSEEKSLTNYIKKVNDAPLSFVTTLPGGPDNVRMMPFYQIAEDLQTVYWDVYSPAEWKAVEEKRKAELERIAELDKMTTDYIVFGEMQPERDHNLKGENTRNGEGYLRKYRFAYEDGWFAFDMKCNYDQPMQLLLTYYGGDSRKYTFDVVIGDWVQPVSLNDTTQGFVEHSITIPQEVTKGKDKIRVMFRANDKTRVSNIYNCRLMKMVPEGKAIYIPKDLQGMDLNNSDSKWSYHRMAYTENFVVFWEKGFGNDLANPPQLEGHKMQVDLPNLEEKLERFYLFFRDTLKFSKPGSKCDKYRMMVMLNYSLEGTAYGGDYDGEIGALWIAPNRIQDKKLNCIAHELGHSFQAQISCDDEGEAWGGCGFFEMTSQWMLWQVNPDWITDEKYHWDAFMKLTHKAYLHLENIYHSPYVLEYWGMKRGLPFIAELYRQGKKGEDPVITYKRMTGLSQAQFCDEMFDTYRHFINWDFARTWEATRPYANKNTCILTPNQGGWFRIAAENCPENYGFNTIPLTIPKAGETVEATFKGLAGENGYTSIQTDKAGWRYGFVGITNEGKSIYGEMKRNAQGKVKFATPQKEKLAHLYLLIMGAPTEHWINPVPKEKDAQWPYQIKLKNSQPVFSY